MKAEIPPFKGPVSKQVEEEEDLGYVQVKTEMFNYGGQEYSDDDDDYNQEFIGVNAYFAGCYFDPVFNGLVFFA